jgi:hypothetical protein
MFKVAVFWLSFLVFAILALNIFFLIKSKKRIVKILHLLSLILCVVFIWPRFVEPQLITVQTTRIQFGIELKVALISDIHLGVYKGSGFLERVVKTINEQPDIDMVLVAGDFTYEPDKDKLRELFEPLSDLNVPVYAVLGNHDAEQPGPKLRPELNQALVDNGVKIIDNQILDQGGYKIIGLGDKWAKEDEVELLEQVLSTENVLVLTHNPDTILDFPTNRADLTLTGHTHCGQVRIPYVYKYFLPIEGDFDKGLTQEPTTQLFITCGLGEVGLPLRLFNPPVIDILELY